MKRLLLVISLINESPSRPRLPSFSIKSATRLLVFVPYASPLLTPDQLALFSLPQIIFVVAVWFPCHSTKDAHAIPPNMPTVRSAKRVITQLTSALNIVILPLPCSLLPLPLLLHSLFLFLLPPLLPPPPPLLLLLFRQILLIKI
jgi:hypothetical protein